MYPYDNDEDLDDIEIKLLDAILRSKSPKEQYELSLELRNYWKMFETL